MILVYKQIEEGGLQSMKNTQNVFVIGAIFVALVLAVATPAEAQRDYEPLQRVGDYFLIFRRKSPSS